MPSNETTPSSPAWHALAAEAVRTSLGTEPRTGLSREEVLLRRRRHGPNSLPHRRGRSLVLVFASQFQSPLIYLLFAAAAVAFFIGERKDAAVILVVVFVNAIIGALQEGRAERSLAALRQLAGLKSRVVRSGREEVVEAGDLVPGDILVLAAGDAVGSDARLLECAQFQTAEAALTGESLPVAKDPAPLGAETVLADRRNMVYAGTHATAGRALAAVVATGQHSEIGRIAAMAESTEGKKTPLELRVAQFGRTLVIAAIVVFLGVLGLGHLQGQSFAQIFMIAISQMVSMVPEGLPVAMTIALAVGVQRMARRRAIVRRLSAVETLGSTTLICSDKTGTLTKNEMTVTAIYLPGEPLIEVGGTGYEPKGDFRQGGTVVTAERSEGLRRLLEAAVLCNDATLSAPEEGAPRWRILGDPTEGALITAAAKAGIDAARTRDSFRRTSELPFDPDSKLMATEHATPDGPLIILKGAPEVILDSCATELRGGQTHAADDRSREAAREAAESMAARALRILGVAMVRGGPLVPADGFSQLRGRAVLLGLFGQLDPPRPEVAEAVETCRKAGIRAVMVTGDHKVTGRAVAGMLGMAREGEISVDGPELARMSEGDLASKLDTIAVFARVHPAQKMRIVEAYQRRGDVVAMTGDGVNDAPALARADVGVAMGLTGTDVAKEAAKIIVTDDNFATIVSAVEEGRLVYRNIKKVVLYLFSTSMAEVLVLTAALVLGYPPPLAAVQILWINIVTEGTVTVNLIMERSEGDEMLQPPIPRGEPLLTAALLRRVLFMTPSIALSTFGWFVVRTSQGVPAEQVRTETFTVLAVCQWFNVLNCRSATASALNFRVLTNPWLVTGLILSNLLHMAVIFLPPLQAVFHTVAIPWKQVFAIGAAASLVLWVEEIRKWIVRRSLPRAAPAPQAPTPRA